jgi:hypothetical protein
MSRLGAEPPPRPQSGCRDLLFSGGTRRNATEPMRRRGRPDTPFALPTVAWEQRFRSQIPTVAATVQTAGAIQFP